RNDPLSEFVLPRNKRLLHNECTIIGLFRNIFLIKAETGGQIPCIPCVPHRKTSPKYQIPKKELKYMKSNKLQMSGRLDLNQRPHDPQSCALPDCATSRMKVIL